MAVILLILLLLLPLPALSASTGWQGMLRLWHDNIEVEGNRHALTSERWWYGGETGYALSVTSTDWSVLGGVLLRAEAGGQYNIEPWMLGNFAFEAGQFWLGTTTSANVQPEVLFASVAAPRVWLARLQGQGALLGGMVEAARLQAPGDLRSEILYVNGFASLTTGALWRAALRTGFFLYHRAGHDTGGTGWRRPVEASGQLNILWSDVALGRRVGRSYVFVGSGILRSLGSFGVRDTSGTAVTASAGWKMNQNRWKVAAVLTGRVMYDAYRSPLAEAWIRDDGLGADRFRRQLQFGISGVYGWRGGPQLYGQVRQAFVWRDRPVWFNQTELGIRWWFGEHFR